MPNKLPKSYDVQDGCHNCVDCYVKDDIENPAEYFCTLGAPKRPKSNVWSDEAERWPVLSGDGEWEECRDFWVDWVTGRYVEAHGLCNHWGPGDD